MGMDDEEEANIQRAFLGEFQAPQAPSRSSIALTDDRFTGTYSGGAQGDSRKRC